MVEGGKVVGVRSVCKATQYEELFTCVVRFVAHGNGNFEKGAVEISEASSDDRIVAASIALAAVHKEKWTAMLPPAKREGPDTIERGSAALGPIEIKHYAATEVLSGEAKFVVAIDNGPAKAMLGSDPAGDGDGGDAAAGLQLRQKVVSPEISISNPAGEGQIAIAKIAMEWKQADGSWTAFGVTTLESGGWVSSNAGSAINPFVIGEINKPIRSRRYNVVGAELVAAGEIRIDDQGDPRARRLHPSFAEGAAEPLVCRVLVIDDQGATAAVCFEYADAPVEDHPREYEAALRWAPAARASVTSSSAWRGSLPRTRSRSSTSARS